MESWSEADRRLTTVLHECFTTSRTVNPLLSPPLDPSSTVADEFIEPDISMTKQMWEGTLVGLLGGLMVMESCWMLAMRVAHLLTWRVAAAGSWSFVVFLGEWWLYAEDFVCSTAYLEGGRGPGGRRTRGDNISISIHPTAGGIENLLELPVGNKICQTQRVPSNGGSCVWGKPSLNSRPLVSVAFLVYHWVWNWVWGCERLC